MTAEIEDQNGFGVLGTAMGHANAPVLGVRTSESHRILLSDTFVGWRRARNHPKTAFWLYPVDVKSMKIQPGSTSALLVLTMGCLLWGCQAPSITRGGFNSGSPAARTHAIEITVAEARKSGSISRSNLKSMVELLNADDDLVRFMAISGLTEISGDGLGYRFFDPRAVRFSAVQRWRTYALESNGSEAIRIEPEVGPEIETETGT